MITRDGLGRFASNGSGGGSSLKQSTKDLLSKKASHLDNYKAKGAANRKELAKGISKFKTEQGSSLKMRINRIAGAKRDQYDARRKSLGI